MGTITMEKLQNAVYLNNRDETVDASWTSQVELIGVLFGGYWDENSRKFNETLSELYNYINTETLKFQVIYVNNDQNSEQFDRFRQQMPWLALKFDEQMLCYDQKKIRS